MPSYQVITRLPSGITEIDAYVTGARYVSVAVGPPGAPGPPGPSGGTETVAGIAAISGDVPLFTTAGGTARIVTPEQYGAVGGIVTDDSAAFQAAVNALDAAGGGVLLLTQPNYVTKFMLRPGINVTSLAKGQMQTGAGFVCKLHMPSGGTGFMIEGYIAQKVTVTGTGGYTLTGGWNGSGTTATINTTDSTATILTKVRALPGFGAVTLDAAATASLYRIELDASIGDHAINGSIKPAKLTVAVVSGSPTVTVKALSCDGSGVHGICLLGTVATITAQSQGGIRMRDQTRFSVDGLSGNGFNMGVLKVGGVGSDLKNINALNFAATSLTEPIGVVTLYGADHTLDGGELSGTTLPGQPLGDATNQYHCALVVMSTTTTVRNILAEFGDTDIYAGGALGRYEHCRVDMPGGHGIYEPTYAYDNRFTDTLILSPSTTADNTYDGMNLNGIGHTVRGVSCEVAVNNISTARARYVLFENDVTTDAQTSRQYPSSVDGLVADVNSYGTDLYLSIFTRPAYHSGTGNPSVRPQSSHMAGRSWYDARASRMTYSDGSKWRDSAGEIVGNLLTGSLATMKSASGWQCTDATPLRADGHTDFHQPWMVQLTTLALGVTNGHVAVASTGAASQPQIDAERQYTAACHALGPSGTTVTFTVTWRDSGGSTISSSSTTAQAVGTTDTLAIATFSATAPANAASAYLTLTFARSGLTVGDVFKFARATLVPGTTANESEYP